MIEQEGFEGIKESVDLAAMGARGVELNHRIGAEPMAHIPEEAIERVKRETDLLALVRSRGDRAYPARLERLCRALSVSRGG